MAREPRPAEARAIEAGYSSYYEYRQEANRIDPDHELPSSVRAEATDFAHDYQSGDMTRDQIRDYLDDMGFFDYMSDDDFWEFLKELYA